jgi:hypothetical protein
MVRNHRTIFMTVLIGVLAVALLSGCGFFGGGSPEPTPTSEPRALVPTFTPTPEGAVAAEQPQVATPVPVQPQEGSQESASPVETPPAEEAPAEEAPAEPTPEPATSTPEPPKAKLYVNIDIVNVRQGPGVTYGLVGTAEKDTELEIIGKNEQGDWWQICCVNGEPGWIFGELARVENAESVAVAENIPAPPPPPTQAPAPTQAPPPPEEQAPPPQPQGDPDAGPCGGDDGCKFRIVGGPTTGGNGGMELKLQLAFVHGGRGDEAQGSYFVVLKKDGVKLPVPDSVRSVAGAKSPGPLGEFNYEYSLGTGDLPGNTVAGAYTIWVLDGNGERDSDIFHFNIDNPQDGLVWIKFDQS